MAVMSPGRSWTMTPRARKTRQRTDCASQPVLRARHFANTRGAVTSLNWAHFHAAIFIGGICEYCLEAAAVAILEQLSVTITA